MRRLPSQFEKRIGEVDGVAGADVRSGRLVDILTGISRRRSLQ